MQISDYFQHKLFESNESEKKAALKTKRFTNKSQK